MRLKLTIILTIFILQLIPTVSAQNIEAVELRLDTSIQYPNDRDIGIVVEAMGFADNKPSRSKIDVQAELRWPNGTSAQTISTTVDPGIRTSIIFDKQDVVGTYFVFATASIDNVVSNPESQRTRVTYAPQEYTAGFLDSGRFLVTPLGPASDQITVQEYLDSGTGITEGRQWVISGNESLDIEVPKGYMAIRYNVVDENGWMNYERANSGLTVHGTPYVWLYGDLTRIEPVSSFVATGSIVFGIVGGCMVLAGVSRYVGLFIDERAKRRKELGLDKAPSWRERSRQKQYRKEIDRQYEMDRRRRMEMDRYRRW